MNSKNHNNIFNIDEHEEMLGMTNNNSANNPPLGSNI